MSLYFRSKCLRVNIFVMSQFSGLQRYKQGKTTEHKNKHISKFDIDFQNDQRLYFHFCFHHMNVYSVIDHDMTNYYSEFQKL